MRILVDMDGVIADFEGSFINLWKQQYPRQAYIPLEDRKTFYLLHQYPQELQPLAMEIISAPGFYRGLDVIPGAVEALHEMVNLGIDVRICSSPARDYHNCVLEKYEWVDEHLGSDWIGRMILTEDKTLIRGDILIDDRPELPGSDTPTWEHVLYDQPYNRAVGNKRRLTWQNWKTVLKEVLPLEQR
ncbi:MAG: 5'-3'-deoxyribonucleotidase [Chloroflexi bacterium]|mgnify:CR=1 FL=1|jgi:5'-nucleotidase|nr:5'-3'-deoxyribonucleotidase [Chloroflexota bacterium]